MASPFFCDSGHEVLHNTRHDTGVLAALLPVALVTYLCMVYLDPTVALQIKQHLYANRIWSKYTALIPDALLILVVLVTVGSYLMYRIRVARRLFDLYTVLYKMMAIATPVSYGIKSIAKYLFGRITTREWLQTSGDLGFHWFSGGDRFNGFPSGHMVVITVLIAVLWRLQPCFRLLYLFLLLTLAMALIATNYHFLSDVITGAYLGFLVEVCVFNAVMKSFLKRA